MAEVGTGTQAEALGHDGGVGISRYKPTGTGLMERTTVGCYQLLLYLS